MAIDHLLISFHKEILEDLNEIKNNLSDPKLEKEEYAFLYWILLKIYHLDESEVKDYITEGNDGGIDCFVHYPESKELYIIQAKFHTPENNTKAGEFSDFCMRPYATLMKGEYNHNPKLQKIFTKAINDGDYKIYFRFYSTSYNIPKDVQTTKDVAFKLTSKAYVAGDYFGLERLREQYWGESIHPAEGMKFKLKTINRGTVASIDPQYQESLPYKARYIFVPVHSIYQLKKEADKIGYKLFDENIREFLGENAINKQIIDTLRDANERKRFVFYNNGITIICKQIGSVEREISSSYCAVTNPQVVNGCQTVNAIYRVLDEVSEEKVRDFDDVYVLVKVLQADKNLDNEFYHNVVKYSNSQNNIPSKVFATAEKSVFARLKDELEGRGFLLQIKQSDKNTNKEMLKSKKDFFVKLAQNFLDYMPENNGVKFKDICFELEKFLQVLIIFMKGGYFGFTKKAVILKPKTDCYENYSLCIQDYFSINNMIKLFFLYWRAEQERKQSEDKRSPIPYYVIGFLGYHLAAEDREDKRYIDAFLNRVFSPEMFESVYTYITTLVNDYHQAQKKDGIDYNSFIKQPVNRARLDDLIDECKKWEGRGKGPKVSKYLSEYREDVED